MKTGNPTQEKQVEDLSETEEWGAWKIVSDMLDTPMAGGLYGTSECYLRLYKFVMAQKAKAKLEERKLVLSEIGKGVDCGCGYHKESNDVTECTDPEVRSSNVEKEELRQKTLKRIEELEKQ